MSVSIIIINTYSLSMYLYVCRAELYVYIPLYPCISDTSGLHASLSWSPFIWHRPCVNIFLFFCFFFCFHFCFCRWYTMVMVVWREAGGGGGSGGTLTSSNGSSKYSESYFILTFIAPVCCCRCARERPVYIDFIIIIA